MIEQPLINNIFLCVDVLLFGFILFVASLTVNYVSQFQASFLATAHGFPHGVSLQ